MPKKTIAVVGAVNIDMCGTSDEQLILYDSNPASTLMSFGGVGRNIAENTARLGFEVDMITVLADDVLTERLVEYSEKAGISFEHSMHVSDAACSTYMSINNNNGDLILAVSDMKIYDRMTVDFIAEQIEFLNTRDIVIVDTNIPQDVIEYIAEHCTAPMAADPVSTTKALKLKNCVGKFTMIKPNIYEAENLSGIAIEDDASMEEAANYFHEKGVKYVFVSMAEEGVYYSDTIKRGSLPICKKGVIRNVSGCGDAFFSAAVWAYLNDKEIRDIARAGECASCISANSIETVTQELTVENIEKLMDEYLV